MLDTIRMCGRWIARVVLEKITARTLSPQPPSRQELIAEFCRRTQWRNRKGQLCLSSANVCLKRLEKEDLIRLPPPAPRSPRSGKRRLRDDGQPLPPLPQLPHSVAQIPDLRLRLLADEQDPQHLLWNRLISREHPLQGAPLVGAQLRYLIVAGEQDILGAIGFGPPAFYLACRDCWIGWDAQAREQNRALVICLSRFLIRPGLRCANLASSCYRRVLQQVRGDWLERYGTEPLLVETYVDRSTYTGKSLVAANWLRIGQSLGRGRSTARKADRPRSRKDVWVWQWDPQARARLQQRALPQVVPRSIFSPSLQADWIQEELDGLDLGHVKLDQRFAQMLQGRWAHPDRSFYTSFDGARGGKAAYAFIENPRAELHFSKLLAPHSQNTRRRMAAESVVLLAQDTTALSYNTLEATSELGPIGNKLRQTRGLLLHSLQAFRLDGIPLGCAWAQVWARDPRAEAQTAHRNEQSIEEKESVRWVDAFQAAVQIAAQMPQTTVFVSGDRESDIMELYDRQRVAPPNVHYLIRAQHDRILDSGEKLWDHLPAQPCGGTMTVQVPRRKAQPARTATLQLRWTQIEIKPPRVGCKNSWGPFQLWALQAQEIEPPEGLPEGVEPIEWTLLTDWKIDSLKNARRLVCWYGLRWGIECWHQVLKDVCKVETRQMKSAQALTRALVLDLIVAWRVLLLCRFGKGHPNVSASLLYSPEEIAILEVLKKKDLTAPLLAEGRPPDPDRPVLPQDEIGSSTARGLQAPEPSSLTLLEANILVAQLAGFWARKADGHPGPDIMGRGLLILAALVRWERGRAPKPLHCARRRRSSKLGTSPPSPK